MWYNYLVFIFLHHSAGFLIDGHIHIKQGGEKTHTWSAIKCYIMHCLVVYVHRHYMYMSIQNSFIPLSEEWTEACPYCTTIALKSAIEVLSEKNWLEKQRRNAKKKSYYMERIIGKETYFSMHFIHGFLHPLLKHCLLFLMYYFLIALKKSLLGRRQESLRVKRRKNNTVTCPVINQ